MGIYLKYKTHLFNKIKNKNKDNNISRKYKYMNYFYLKKIEKFSDVVNDKVDYAYFVNPDNMAQIIINDMWNIYYSSIINDNRFPSNTSEITYDDLMKICDDINNDAIVKVTNHLIPIFVNQFVFKQDDQKISNTIAKVYLKERDASMVIYYSKMIHFFPQLPKGYDETKDLMTSSSYSNEYTPEQLIANQLTNVKKHINNCFICSLTLNLNKVNLHKMLLNKNSNNNITFSLPLSVDVLYNIDVNVLILLKGITESCNNFVTESKISKPLTLDSIGTTVPIPEKTQNHIKILLQLNDIITFVNAKNAEAAKKKKIDLSSPSTNNQSNNNKPQNVPFYMEYKIYIVIAIIIFLLFSSSLSCIFMKNKNNQET